MLPFQIEEYLDAHGRSPFGRWFDDLDARAAARVRTALDRLSAGNTSRVKPVGAGVNEVRVDFGPGYRVYFGWDGPVLVILLGGGTKKRQERDIVRSQELWKDYKHRKKRKP